MKKIVSIIISAILLLALAYSVYNQIQKNSEIKEINNNESGVNYGVNSGQYVYDYKLEELLSGKETNLHEEIKGKKSIIIFWASWCPYCKDTVLALNELIKEEDINVVGINVPDVESNKKDPISFVEQNKLEFKNYTGETSMYEHFFLQSFPTIVFVDKEGKIIKGVVGGLTKDIILQQFEEQ